MAKNEKNTQNPEAPKDESILATLENRLAARPSEETDVMEFLAIAGLEYRNWKPLREASLHYENVRHLYDTLEAKRLERRRNLSNSDRTTERSVCKALWYDYSSGLIQTVGDLRPAIEQNKRMPSLGPKGRELLISYFKHYGISQKSTLQNS